MTKAELGTRLITACQTSQKQGDKGGLATVTLTKTAAGDVLDVVLREIGLAIKKEGRFSYPNFGTFLVRKRAARKGRNPRTGADMKIKASKTVVFRPAPSLKKTL